MSCKLLVIGAVLSILVGCGDSDCSITSPITAGERIGNLTDICLVERTTVENTPAWAYGVCADEPCSRFIWVYGGLDGAYLGESDLLFADTRCHRP